MYTEATTLLGGDQETGKVTRINARDRNIQHLKER